MSQDFVEHNLYQSFSQENQDISSPYSGCGMGLAISREIVHLMDGLEATQAIRSLEREDAKTTPILAVSANAFEEDVRKSLDSGMNEHLAKPVDARLLYQKIKEYCKA